MILKPISGSVAGLLISTLSVLAQPAAQQIDLSRLGPQIGEIVPDFRLQDGQGKTWTRESIMGPKGAMLVFSRSADW
jgi:hypothetical protein